MLLRIQDRAKCGKGTILHRGGGHLTGKNVYWEGGHRTYFIDGGNIWGGDFAQICKKKGRLTVAEPMSWLVGCGAYELAQLVIIVPLRGSILQADTCQILSLAVYPRWSRV